VSKGLPQRSEREPFVFAIIRCRLDWGHTVSARDKLGAEARGLTLIFSSTISKVE
jgi:hypothetical protein